MTTTSRLRLEVASGKAYGNEVSSREARFFLRAWGPSRFPTSLPAHGWEIDP